MSRPTKKGRIGTLTLGRIAVLRVMATYRPSKETSVDRTVYLVPPTERAEGEGLLNVAGFNAPLLVGDLGATDKTSFVGVTVVAGLNIPKRRSPITDSSEFFQELEAAGEKQFGSTLWDLVSIVAKQQAALIGLRNFTLPASRPTDWRHVGFDDEVGASNADSPESPDKQR